MMILRVIDENTLPFVGVIVSPFIISADTNHHIGTTIVTRKKFCNRAFIIQLNIFTYPINHKNFKFIYHDEYSITGNGSGPGNATTGEIELQAL
jgi:hypothetical protein